MAKFFIDRPVFAWVVALVIMLAGGLIRQFFVLRHRGESRWWLPLSGTVLLVGLMVALAPKSLETASGNEQVSFAQVQQVLKQRCVTCHAAQPTQPGFAQPPKGVMLEARHLEAMALGYFADVDAVTAQDAALYAAKETGRNRVTVSLSAA